MLQTLWPQSKDMYEEKQGERRQLCWSKKHFDSTYTSYIMCTVYEPIMNRHVRGLVGLTEMKIACRPIVPDVAQHNYAMLRENI